MKGAFPASRHSSLRQESPDHGFQVAGESILLHTSDLLRFPAGRACRLPVSCNIDYRPVHSIKLSVVLESVEFHNLVLVGKRRVEVTHSCYALTCVRGALCCACSSCTVKSRRKCCS